MAKRKRRSFTPEYKAEVVGLVRSSGKTVGQVARELDLTASMTMSRQGMLMLTVGAGLLLAPTARTNAAKDELGFVRIKPEDVVWKDMPGYEGVKFAIVEGDPKKEGIYV